MSNCCLCVDAEIQQALRDPNRIYFFNLPQPLQRTLDSLMWKDWVGLCDYYLTLNRNRCGDHSFRIYRVGLTEEEELILRMLKKRLSLVYPYAELLRDWRNATRGRYNED